MSKKIKKVNGMKYYVVISLVAVLAVGTAAIAYSVSNNINVEGDYNYYESEGQPEPGDLILGAFPGPDVYADVNVHGTFTYGGGYSATTTLLATHTITGRDLTGTSFISVMNAEPSISDLTWTLPATSTMIGFLPELGSTRAWTFLNATTSGDVDSKLIFVTGDGMDLLTASSTKSLTLDAEDYAEITCMRTVYHEDNDEEVMCVVERYFNAD